MAFVGRRRQEKEGKEEEKGEPVAQRQEMVIGTLALLWYFEMVAVMGAGQRFRREPKETKSCRTRRICTSIRQSLPPPEAPQRLTQASQRLALSWEDRL